MVLHLLRLDVLKLQVSNKDSRTLKLKTVRDAFAAKQQGKTAADIARASQAGIPMGRYGTVEEFAAVAAFLAGAGASYVTGSLLRVDGGYIRSI